MLSDGKLNLAHTAADSAASGLLPRQGEVAAKPPEGAPAFPTESPSSSSSSASSPPDSPCATPHSPRPAAPRRAVPTTFNPIINDEANILAAISRGDRTLFDLAEEHATTVSNLCVWLQREDIQQKLNDLSTCGAQLTRVAAVNQLPKAVKAMAFQIEAHIFDRTHNLIKPGLAADKISALRDANARKACNLLLRLARFDPSLPLYRAPKLLPRSDRGIELPLDDAAKRHAPSRPTTDELLQAVIESGALSKLPQGGAVEAGFAAETEGAPALSTEPLCLSSAVSGIPFAFSVASQDLAHTNSNGHHHNGNGNGKLTSSTSPLRHSATSPRARSRPPPR